jgi:hypothetical protein
MKRTVLSLAPIPAEKLKSLIKRSPGIPEILAGSTHPNSRRPVTRSPFGSPISQNPRSAGQRVLE